ncbi:penicillin acylase family protein [Qipengyuania sp. S6317L1]|uniref:penicillin acylase family protein n=1 Tax=Qipengyuania sp. S6317L1 TaxID=2926410 RepID=UPI001FF2AD30|nr:penicillin acylase family protein [Qipengyuania sp. S6317L1]MCK0100620.1 penicillin acylase family protein [Qipengyuania sp. S6317L1]
MRVLAQGFGALLASTALAGAALADDHSPYSAEITRTTHNIAHIDAGTWEGVGYGVAYAYAEDNICMLAEEFVSVRGERSLFFGPEGKNELGLRGADNLTSDIFFRSQIDLPALREGAQQTSTETQALMAGYVAGYNRFLYDNPVSTLPERCRDADWVRPITSDDMLRLTEKTMLLASSLALAGGIANAQPPSGGQASAKIKTLTFPAPPEPSYGSNGWAFGSDVTADGKGLLIGNPHFPWEGPARFWQMHVRGPDGYDVMGVGLAGTPLPTLGFNKDVAWTHTVTKARHFTVYMLALDPSDPTYYMVDGESVPMEEITVSVPMPEGEEPVERTLYSTQFGRIVTVEGTPMQWQPSMAFALKDANSGNQRGMDTWLQMGRASNVGEVEAAVSETLGIPWVNTIAADREGNALHADITAVPNVSPEFAQTCGTPFSGMVADQVTLLDGTRSACDWSAVASEGAVPWLLPASDQASRTRTDYVTNSNDSYWLSHAGEPYRELSPILGAYKTQLSLRSRSNYTETEATLAEAPMDHARAKELVFGNKVLAADMTLDALLAECEGSNSLSEACGVLANWDRRVNIDSNGAHLFLAFWDKVRRSNDLWEVPFDKDAPIATPSGFKAGAPMLEKLGEAAEELTAKGIALDAPWGMVQTRMDGEESIPIHGATGLAGILNMQESIEIEGGLTPRHGSSYIQIIGFDDDGPVADAILSYSQSANPASPFYADQTRLYSAKEWHRLPFSDEEIEAARIGETVSISE